MTTGVTSETGVFSLVTKLSHWCQPGLVHKTIFFSFSQSLNEGNECWIPNLMLLVFMLVAFKTVFFRIFFSTSFSKCKVFTYIVHLPLTTFLYKHLTSGFVNNYTSAFIDGKHCQALGFQVSSVTLFGSMSIACITDGTNPRYSPSANQRPKACSNPPRVTRLFL